MRFSALCTAVVLLATISASLGVRDLFRCPPSNRWYSSQAYRVPVPGGFLPVLSSEKPGSKKPEVCIIPCHGARQEQEEYFSTMLNKVVKRNEQKKGSTVVVAPAFQSRSCYANQWPPNKHVAKVPSPTWTGPHSYYTGSDGSEKDELRMSSYKALDTVVSWAVESYPKLLHVVITGFSAGSQMVLGWAIMSPAGANGHVTLKGSKVDLRIVIQSPGSTIYLTDHRPAKECIPVKETGPFHTCSSFPVPDKNACGWRNWDVWKFGVAGFEEGESSAQNYPALTKYLQESISIGGKWSWGSSYQPELVDRFGTKNVHVQVGNQDDLLCTVGMCQGSCPAMLSGSSRLQRAQNLAAYFEWLYPNRPQLTSLPFGIFDGGHRDYAGFESAFFALWTFQQPFAKPPPAKLPDTWVKYDGKNCYHGHGAEQILINNFAIVTENVDVCQDTCKKQLQPLCEGVVVRSGSGGVQCWLVMDVNVRHCRGDRGTTFYHLTYEGEKGAELAGLAPDHWELSGASYDDSADDTGARKGSLKSPVAAGLLILIVVACGLALALSTRGRAPKRYPRSVELGEAECGMAVVQKSGRAEEEIQLLAAAE